MRETTALKIVFIMLVVGSLSLVHVGPLSSTGLSADEMGVLAPAAAPSNAQENNILQPAWYRTWGGNGLEMASDVVFVDGYLYVAGETKSYGEGKSDVFLLKYNEDGELIWSKTWGGTGEDRVGGIEYAGGYLYIAGITDSYGNGKDDALLLKYDLDGKLIWYRTWGGTEDDWAVRAVPGSDGNIYVAGWAKSFGAGKSDIILLEYTPDGDLIDNYSWGGEGTDADFNITSRDGYLYVTGITDSYGSEGTDAVLLKYDEDGNLVWQRIWGGELHDWANKTYVTDDYIYVSGIVDWGTGENKKGIGGDAILRKYDVDGNLIWSRTWGGEDGEESFGVDVSPGGFVYMSGYTHSYATSGQSVYHRDIFLVKYDQDGNLLFWGTWGGDYIEETWNQVISDDALYIAGNTYSSLFQADAFLLKIPLEDLGEALTPPWFLVVVGLTVGIIITVSIVAIRRLA